MSIQTHNVQLHLSIFIILNLVPLCIPLSSNATYQSSSSASASNPVIHSLQILLNNSIQLQFKSYQRVKDFASELSQLQLSKKSQSGELILVTAEHFDAQKCLLRDLPARVNYWFALIDLKNDCSTIDVILNVFKSARLINTTLLRGVFFYLDEFPSGPNLHNVTNRSG